MSEISEDARNAVRDLLQEYVVSPVSVDMESKLDRNKETLDDITDEAIKKVKNEDLNPIRNTIRMVLKKQDNISESVVEYISENTDGLFDIKKSCDTIKTSCRKIKNGQEQSQKQIFEENEKIYKKLEENGMTVSKSLDSLLQGQCDTNTNLKNIASSAEEICTQYSSLQTKVVETSNNVCSNLTQQIQNSQKTLNESVKNDIGEQREKLYKDLEKKITDIDKKLIFDAVTQRIDDVKGQAATNKSELSQTISDYAGEVKGNQESLKTMIENGFCELNNKMERQYNAANDAMVENYGILLKKYGTLLKITLMLGGLDLIGVVAALVVQLI